MQVQTKQIFVINSILIYIVDECPLLNMHIDQGKRNRLFRVTSLMFELLCPPFVLISLGDVNFVLYPMQHIAGHIEKLNVRHPSVRAH